MFVKLVFTSVFVVISSILLETLYNKYRWDQSRVFIDLDSYTNPAWAEECKNYIVEYLTDWANETFTDSVAMCRGICSPNLDSSVVVTSKTKNCDTFPVMFVDNGETTSGSNRTHSENTVPCFLNITTSKIPGANRGIFTRIRIPKGTIFGPYTGSIKSAYGDEGDEARNGGYAWRVNRYNENGEEDDFYIDGISENNSNWLRFVNAARFEEEQNLYVLIFNDTVYYMTYKDVEVGEELLTWYGKNYAYWLSIETLEGSEHDWETDFAPKKEIVICDSCEKSRASLNMKSRQQEEEEAEEQEEEEKEKEKEKEEEKEKEKETPSTSNTSEDNAKSPHHDQDHDYHVNVEEHTDQQSHLVNAKMSTGQQIQPPQVLPTSI